MTDGPTPAPQYSHADARRAGRSERVRSDFTPDHIVSSEAPPFVARRDSPHERHKYRKKKRCIALLDRLDESLTILYRRKEALGHARK